MEYILLLLLFFVLIPVLSQYRLVRIKQERPLAQVESEQQHNPVASEEVVLSSSNSQEHSKRQMAVDRLKRIHDAYHGRNDQLFNVLIFDDAFFATLRYEQGALDFLHQSKRVVSEDDSIKSAIYYTQEIKRDPHQAAFYTNRGHSFMRMGMHKHALQDFSKAIELNDKESYYYYNRGFAWLALGEHGMAWFDWLQACKMGNEPARRMIYQ